MLETMVDCAHALGLAFGEAARAETDHKRRLELADAFQRSFLALRMGIRLSLTLRAAPKVSPAAAIERAEPSERERPERDPPERDRSDSAERERDRDYEPVSLPRFLATLGVVARDAQRLDDRLPAEAGGVLPALQDLLARAKSDPLRPEPAPKTAPAPAGGVALLARLPSTGPKRALLGSAAASLSRPARAPPRRSSG